MPKYLFKPSQNVWFSYLAFTTSLLLLGQMVLSDFINLSHNTMSNSFYLIAFYPYFVYLIYALVFMITIAAWQLTDQLTLRPFLITIIAFLSLILGFALARWGLINTLSVNLFCRMMLCVLALSLLWWTCSLTVPTQFSYAYSKNKIFRPFAWLGLILIVSQIAFGCSLRALNQGLICSNFPFCTTQKLPLYDLPGVYQFWQSGTIAFADMQIILQMLHRSLVLIIIGYIGLFSVFLIKNAALRAIGVFYFLLIAIKLYFSFFTVTLSPVIISTIHYSISLLLLLTTISLLSNLFLKVQSSW